MTCKGSLSARVVPLEAAPPALVPDLHRVDQLVAVDGSSDQDQGRRPPYGSDDSERWPPQAAVPVLSSYVNTLTVLPVIRTVMKAVLLASDDSKNQFLGSAVTWMRYLPSLSPLILIH